MKVQQFGGTPLKDSEGSMILFVSPQDAHLLRAMLEKHPDMSPENMEQIGANIMKDYMLKAETRYGGNPPPQPTKRQVFVLSYASTYRDWFGIPSDLRKHFNRRVLKECEQQGWILIDGKRLRITSDGRAALRRYFLT